MSSKDEEFSRCPVHAEPDSDRLHAWACPTDCEHFLAEIEHRIDEVTDKGNFFRLFRKKGLSYTQEYRHHKPYGRRQPMTAMNEWKQNWRRTRAEYHRKHR